MTESSTSGLLLRGLKGSNPLGFLAALGTAATAARIWPSLRWGWSEESGDWIPELRGCTDNPADFAGQLHEFAVKQPQPVWDIANQLPFAASTFRNSLVHHQATASASNRTMIDLLAGLGSEVHAQDDGDFPDTRLRMIRKGDSANNGLPAYARSLRSNVELKTLLRDLFQPWEYRDDAANLRWDPADDQRHALGWHDPRQAAKKSVKTNSGANCLALESLALLPTFSHSHGIATTGMGRSQHNREVFRWPIWRPAITLSTTRSILSLAELRDAPKHRNALQRRGICVVYASERRQQSKYYSNFCPAEPL